jgi:hypothetical protein
MKLDTNTILILAAAGVGFYIYSQNQKKKGEAVTDEQGGGGGGGGSLPLPPIFPTIAPTPAPAPKPAPKPTYTATKTNIQQKSMQQMGVSQSADPNKLKGITGFTISGSYTPTGTGGNVTGLPPSGFSSGVFGKFSGKEPLTINNLLM